MPEFFGPFSRSAFWSMFFRLFIDLPLLPTSNNFANLLFFKPWILTPEKRGPSYLNWGHGGVKWFGQCPKENIFFSIDSSLIQRRESIPFPSSLNSALKHLGYSRYTKQNGAENLPFFKRKLFTFQQFKSSWVLTIPHICHGSHGYIRVNFFWPV